MLRDTREECTSAYEDVQSARERGNLERERNGEGK